MTTRPEHVFTLAPAERDPETPWRCHRCGVRTYFMGAEGLYTHEPWGSADAPHPPIPRCTVKP